MTGDRQGILGRTEEGYKGYLDHKQYNKEDEANDSDQVR